MAWYSGVEYESYAFLNRATGPMAWSYWVMMTCNVVSPQLMWVKKWRRNLMFTFIMSIVVNIGMWFERFVIIVTSLHRGHLPSTWTHFYPTWVDVGVFLGTIGIFSVLYLLYARFFPVLAISEVKTILKSSGENFKDDFGHGKGYYTSHSHDEVVAEVETKEEVKVVEEKAVEAPKTETTKSSLTDEEFAEKQAALIEKLGVGSADNADDLKLISGVGPVFEKTLNKIGIFTFEQVSKMTKAEYDLLDSLTEKFPGRAERDNWAGQAEELINKK
jgi:molybdopterin-containing oxidoreductase family membrane subunit